MPFDVNNYLAATNTFRRVIETIGLRRVPREIDSGPLERHFATPHKQPS
jgi:hypothetical protein